MKTVMILGGGVYQLPLIKKAQELGYRTVVVTPSGPYPGISIADVHVDLDTTNIKAVLDVARRFEIDGVVTCGTDVAVPTIGKIAEELGLKGTKYDAALRSMDKTLMKKAFLEKGVPSAKFVCVDTLNDIDRHIGSLKYPLMVKASDSSGSRGVFKAENFKELKSFFVDSKAVSRNGKVVIEEFVEGVEIGAQAVVIGKEVVKVYVHNDTVTPPPNNAPIGHSMPVDLSDDVLAEIEGVIVLAVAALGIEDAIANVDLMLVDNKPYMLEIGARMGATCLPENISIYEGYDVYEMLLDMALGQDFDLENKIGEAKQPNAALLIRSDKSGVLKSISLADVNLSENIQLVLDVDVGAKVNEFRVGPDRLGHILVKADSAKEAEDLAEEIHQKIVLNVEPVMEFD